MVEIVEILFVVFLMIGSASWGYAVLAFFMADFRSLERKVRLGYAFLAGAGYSLLLILISAGLTTANVGSRSFLEWIFLLYPIVFVLLLLIAVGQKIAEWYELRRQRLEGIVPVVKSKPKEAPVVGEELSPINMNQEEDHFSFSSPKPPFSTEKKETEKTQVEEESVPALEKKLESAFGKLSPAPAVPEKERKPVLPAVNKGEQEKDVEEEVKKIMSKSPSSDTPSNTTASASNPVSDPNAISRDEIERIKRELQKEMDDEHS